MSDDTAPGPLDGVKVLDFSVMISGPLAAMMLADQGADVIKVESPGVGDMMRLIGSQKNGMTGIFTNNNRGKRSIVLDLKHTAAIDVAKQLAAESDVVIQNFRPGAMDRLGLGADDLLTINPDLVYVSISGYGQDGPQANRRAYDHLIQSASGLASVQANKSSGDPELFRTLLCDKTTSYTVAQAITASLFARATGKAAGQHIEVAMLDTAISFIWPDSASDATLLDDDVDRRPTVGENYALTRLADGFAATTALTDSEFAALCAAYGRPDLVDDERFVDAPSRMKNGRDLGRIMREIAAELTVAEFEGRIDEHDVAGSRVVTLAELPSEPQVVNNEVFIERDHPVAGRVREPRPAARLSATPQRVSRPAPTLGEHSDEIVAELGLDAAQLRRDGVIS